MKISGCSDVSCKGESDKIHVAAPADYHVENWVITETMALVEDHIFAKHTSIIIDNDNVTLDLNEYDVTGCSAMNNSITTVSPS